MSVGLRTLVLNGNYQPESLFPLSTITAEKAIEKYLKGTGNVIEWYDRIIKTPSRNDLHWPAVIVTKETRFFNRRLRVSKEILFYMGHCRCAYCNTELTLKTATKDHIIPVSKGGKSTFTNLCICCEKCNSAKSNKQNNRWKPRITPWKPTIFELNDIRSKYSIVLDHESWLTYLPNWSGPVKILEKGK